MAATGIVHRHLQSVKGRQVSEPGACRSRAVGLSPAEPQLPSLPCGYSPVVRRRVLNHPLSGSEGGEGWLWRSLGSMAYVLSY